MPTLLVPCGDFFPDKTNVSIDYFSLVVMEYITSLQIVRSLTISSSNELQMQALYKIRKSTPPHVPDSKFKDARDFILQCLQGNPTSRPTATQLLDHPFVKERLASSSAGESPYSPR